MLCVKRDCEIPVLLTVVAQAAVLTGCSTDAEQDSATKNPSATVAEKESDVTLENEAVVFSPVNCGIQAQDVYEYPFLGLTAKLSQNMLDYMNSRDVFVSVKDDYTDSMTVKTATVGEFKTEDIFGKAYTEDMFGDYVLTLVNAFTTWCSPCVEEMPELENLRKAFEKKGISFNVVAVELMQRQRVDWMRQQLKEPKSFMSVAVPNFHF